MCNQLNGNTDQNTADEKTVATDTSLHHALGLDRCRDDKQRALDRVDFDGADLPTILEAPEMPVSGWRAERADRRLRRF